jgi:hypothetical protein
MAKYTQKPVMVEAEQVTQDNPTPYEKDGAVYKGSITTSNASIYYSNDLWLSVKEGDYVIQRQDGEYYTIPEAEFEACFEPSS